MERLKGKRVVLIGSGSVREGLGNGRACALAYAAEGASVLCVDRNAQNAENTVTAITRQGGAAFALVADATDTVDMARVALDAEVRWGAVDILHNNVGYGGIAGAPDTISPDDWEHEIAINLRSAYLGMHHVVPLIRRAGSGAIVNTSSVMAVRFLRTPSIAYTSAKAAVEALTRASALAYGPENIRVNAIRIGFAETPLIGASLDERGLTAEQKEKAMARSRAKVPLRGEHTDPRDVAAAAVFLASDEARSVTGVILNVDGGVEIAPI